MQTALSIQAIASLMRDQVASLTEHGVTVVMIAASLFEDEQIQRDVSGVFSSPLEKRPPTESIPRSRRCCRCRRSSLRRSVVSLFLVSVLMLFEWN